MRGPVIVVDCSRDVCIAVRDAMVITWPGCRVELFQDPGSAIERMRADNKIVPSLVIFSWRIGIGVAHCARECDVKTIVLYPPGEKDAVKEMGADKAVNTRQFARDLVRAIVSLKI